MQGSQPSDAQRLPAPEGEERPEAPREEAQRLQRTVQDLQRKNRELAACLETASIGVHWVGPDGIIVWANAADMQLLGYGREEYIGRHIAEFHVDRSLIDDMLSRLANGERLRQREARLRCKNGAIKHLLIDSSVLREDGRFIHTQCFSVDITERRRAATELQESESRFRELADHAPVMIWVNGLAGREFANREYLTFAGCSLDEVLGMKWKAFLHPDDSEQYSAAYMRAFEQRGPFEGLVRFRRADGEYRWLRATGVPRFGSDGTFLGYVGCSVDISEIKNSAEVLRETARRKDEFLATLAHELRNPLAPIRTALQIVRLAGADREATENALGMMERQVAYMVRLIEDLLDVNRISRGTLELRMEHVNLQTVIQSAVESSKPLFEQSGHRFNLRLPAVPVYLYADPVRLAQIFSNLLNNAAKYTEKGGRILLTATRGPGEVVVSVRDNGTGIPPSMLLRVFDMFTQVGRELDRHQGGLGVGLSLVKQLVEMHGGKVEARSEGIARGSEFVVRLPVVMPSAEELQLTTDSKETRVPARHRILVAEDNQDTASSLAMMLKIMGNEVRTVSNGLEAVAVGETFQPDVVLLDIGMPKLNGYEACRLIRAEPWGSDVMVIALTGWGQEEDRRRALEAGFNHHLVKPIEPAALEKLLNASRPGYPASLPS